MEINEAEVIKKIEEYFKTIFEDNNLKAAIHKFVESPDKKTSLYLVKANNTVYSVTVEQDKDGQPEVLKIYEAKCYPKL